MCKSLFEKGCLGHVPVSYGGVRGREADFWRNAEIERKTHIDRTIDHDHTEVTGGDRRRSAVLRGGILWKGGGDIGKGWV